LGGLDESASLWQTPPLGKWVEVFAMNRLAFVWTFTALLLCQSSSSAQDNWGWKRWNLFNKSREATSEMAEADGADVDDSTATETAAEAAEQPAASGSWKNPFAQWDLRPRPIEWRTPPAIKRMNENSARFWRKTRRSIGHWASSTGTSIRTSAYDTWDAMTRSIKPKVQEGSGEQLSPNVSGVNEFLSRPKLKF
jgi:hypothetical protein